MHYRLKALLVEAAITILDKLPIDFNYTYANAGDKCKEDTGVALPDETLEIAKKADAVLFGAAGETAAAQTATRQQTTRWHHSCCYGKKCTPRR